MTVTVKNSPEVDPVNANVIVTMAANLEVAQNLEGVNVIVKMDRYLLGDVTMFKR